jgi:hypothetical protein
LKKIIVLLFFCCLFVPFAGTYIWLRCQKHQLKEWVKSQILTQVDKNDLISLTFSSFEAASELHWEHDKEFEYKGQMYDIVESKTNGDTITYICWWDHHETALNIQLTKLVDAGIDKDPLSQRKQEKLKDFFKSIYFGSPQIISFSELRNVLSSYFFLCPMNTIEYYALLSPPPETVS